MVISEIYCFSKFPQDGHYNISNVLFSSWEGKKMNENSVFRGSRKIFLKLKLQLIMEETVGN